MQRSKNFAPLHPSFYAVLCLRRTGLAPMNGKSSLQGGQAERPCPTLSGPGARRPTPGDIAGGSRTHFTEVSVKQKKEKRITLRLTPEQYEKIRFKAETAHMSIGAYVRATALKHRVVVIDGLEEITHELKALAEALTSWRFCPIWEGSKRSIWERSGRYSAGSILYCRS